MRRARRLLRDAGNELRTLGIGGTATGTGINTPRGYRHAVLTHLRTLTGLELTAADDLREAMQSQLPVAAVSGALAGGSFNRVVLALAPPTSPPNAGGVQVIYVTMSGSSPAPDPVGVFVSSVSTSRFRSNSRPGGQHRDDEIGLLVDKASSADLLTCIHKQVIALG